MEKYRRKSWHEEEKKPGMDTYVGIGRKNEMNKCRRKSGNNETNKEGMEKDICI